MTPFLFPAYMKTTIVKLRINPEDKARWQTCADAEGQSLSEYVRDMVDRGQKEVDRVRAILGELEAHRVKSLAK